jgi:hypothetical protein
MNLEFPIPLWYSRGGYYDVCNDEYRNGWIGLAFRCRAMRRRVIGSPSFVMSIDIGVAWGSLNIGRNRR